MRGPSSPPRETNDTHTHMARDFGEEKKSEKTIEGGSGIDYLDISEGCCCLGRGEKRRNPVRFLGCLRPSIVSSSLSDVFFFWGLPYRASCLRSTPGFYIRNWYAHFISFPLNMLSIKAAQINPHLLTLGWKKKPQLCFQLWVQSPRATL